MVDDVVGGVGGGVLLDSDLGDMVDLVVDLVTNLVDNRSCGNMVSSRGNSNCGSWSNSVVSNRGSDRDDWSSVGDRVNKAILVDIFRESLQSQRGIATVSSNKVPYKRSERSTS